MPEYPGRPQSKSHGRLAKAVVGARPATVILASVVLAESAGLVLNLFKSYIFGAGLPRELVLAGAVDALVIALPVGAAIAVLLRKLRVAEHETRDSRSLVDSIITGLAEGVSIIDRDYRVMFQNDAHTRSVGEHLGKVCYESMYGKDAPCEPCPARIAYETGRPHRIERERSTEDGGVRYFGITASPLKDENGEVFASIELVRDITEPKLAELAMRESERRFQQIAQNMDAALWMGTPGDCGLIYASPKFDEIWGVGPEEFSRLRPFWLGGVHEDDRGRAMDKVLASPPGNSYRLEYRIVRPDGSVRWIDNRVFPIFGEDGVVARQAGIAMDVTTRRELDTHKDEMMALLRHDMKNPISVIAVVADTLQAAGAAGDGPDEAYERLDIIKKNAFMLSRMLDDMALIARLESGSGTLNATAIDVTELVLEVRINTLDLARRKGQSLDKDLPAYLPMVWADRMHIERSLGNLVHNAINYTPEGGHISIGAGVETRGNKRYVVVFVTDDGPGIPAGEREKIFEKHYRVSSTSEIPGSGLGLSMVKAAAEANGGFVELSGETGGGSTFRLFLPASR